MGKRLMKQTNGPGGPAGQKIDKKTNGQKIDKKDKRLFGPNRPRRAEIGKRRAKCALGSWPRAGKLAVRPETLSRAAKSVRGGPNALWKVG